MNNHRKLASNDGNMFYFNREKTWRDNASTRCLSLPTTISSAKNKLNLVE